MMSKTRKNLLLVVLACVFAGVLGYFIWIFLAPAAGVPPTVESAAPIDVQTGVVQSQSFKVLQPYAVLPIVPSNVGRANPFLPLPTAEDKAAANAGAAGSAIQNVNGG